MISFRVAAAPYSKLPVLSKIADILVRSKEPFYFEDELLCATRLSQQRASEIAASFNQTFYKIDITEI